MSSHARRGGNSEFSATLTDLMTSLAVIFILLLVVFLKQANDQGKKAKTEVVDQLEQFLKEKSLALQQDPEDPLMLSVKVGEAQMRFPVGGANLSPEGTVFVGSFFSNFATKLCDPALRAKVDSVIIEGHTDRSGEATPQGVRSNIALSQRRSFAVLDQALASVQGDPETYECMLKLTSASGRGSRAPVFAKPPETDVGAPAGTIPTPTASVEPTYDADQSRRVEIKIRVKSSEQQFTKLAEDAAKAARLPPGVPQTAASPRWRQSQP